MSDAIPAEPQPPAEDWRDAAIQRARAAVLTLFQRLQRDPRLAYYFDPFSGSMENLTEAYALLTQRDLESVRAELYPLLKFESPTCAGRCMIAEPLHVRSPGVMV